MVLEPWQKQLIYRLFARRPDGKRRFRMALLGLPRKNGKSGVASALALDGLIFDGSGAEVYSAAAEKEQARIVFGETKKMIARSEELSDWCNPMKDIIDVPATGSIYRVLSAEAYSKEGLNVSRAIIDELHAHPNPDLFEVLTLGTGAREEPMIIVITTAGVTTDTTGNDSICYQQYQHGVDQIEGRVDDPNFFFCWWGAPENSDPTDIEVWKKANPGYGTIMNPDDIADSYQRVPLNEFRTKRLNQWVTATESYLPRGSWEACEDLERVVDSKEPIVVGFDGSLGHDATAIVGCTVSDPPHLFYLKHWQRPFDADPAWQLDYDDVEDTLRDIWRDFNVKEVVADPHLWEQTLHKLSNDGLTIVEFPQRDERMVRATEGLYQAVVKNSVTHDGNEMLARHMANARTLQTSRGIKLTKATKKSPLKIDLAVAGVMAFGVASVLKPAKKPRVYSMSKLLEGGYT